MRKCYWNLTLATIIVSTFFTCLSAIARPHSDDDTETNPPTTTATNYMVIPIQPFTPLGTSTNADVWSDVNFPNVDFSLTLQSFNAQGQISYIVGSAQANGSTYKEIIDFKKYFSTPVPITNNDGTVDIAYLQIGMDYRAEIDFVLSSGSLNAGFDGFSGNATASNIDGTISFSLYGCTNSEAQSSVPMPSAVTPDKIEEFFQSLAVVKNIANSSTAIQPQVIAVYPAGHSVEEVLNRYYSAFRDGKLEIETKGVVNGFQYKFD